MQVFHAIVELLRFKPTTRNEKMLMTLDNPKQTILPAMRSDFDGWQLDGVDDWELEAIFEDENDYETEQTTQGLINETESERHQGEKDARESLIDLYTYRFTNQLDIFTGEPISRISSEDEDSE